MKALVLGGTGFIGRRLVEELLSSGVQVTLATSGNSPNPFEDRVSTITNDRFNRKSLMDSLQGAGFHDVVYDTIGYRSMDMKNVIDAIGDNAGKFVYISSAAVYSGLSGTMGEEMFDPAKLSSPAGFEKSYAEGKKMSEAYLLRNADVPLAIARFPIVMGHDDSTFRFQDHIRRIVDDDEFQFSVPEGKRNHIWVKDAGKFLLWLGKNENSGIYNAASPDSLTASTFVSNMAESFGKEAKIKTGTEKSNSSYSATVDLVLKVEKAVKKGFTFAPTSQWLPVEVKKALDNGLTTPNTMKYTGNLFG